VTMLDAIHVEAYGSKMPLNQVAASPCRNPSLIVAQPFDPVADESDRKRDPAASDPRGSTRRTTQGDPHPIPALTEERRKELSRTVTSSRRRRNRRNVRRDAKRTPEEAPEVITRFRKTDERKGLDEVQKITDNHIKLVESTPEEEGRGAARSSATRLDLVERRQRCRSTDCRRSACARARTEAASETRPPAAAFELFQHI